MNHAQKDHFKALYLIYMCKKKRLPLDTCNVIRVPGSNLDFSTAGTVLTDFQLDEVWLPSQIHWTSIPKEVDDQGNMLVG